MARVTAALSAGTAVFGFDPSPGAAAGRALHVLTVRRGLPRADLNQRDRFEDAALRAVEDAGLRVGSRKGRGAPRLHLVSVEDEPPRSRGITVWYYATAPFADFGGPGAWSSTGRGLRLEARDTAAFRLALEKLRADSRQLAGAVSLLGEVFTGDDLLRLYSALHGGPEGSERTFRRRIQELRDNGVLRPVRESEVAAIRLREPRFRSPSGTGGRPPELLRYSGSGGEDEYIAALRARRAG